MSISGRMSTASELGAARRGAPLSPERCRSQAQDRSPGLPGRGRTLAGLIGGCGGDGRKIAALTASYCCVVVVAVTACRRSGRSRWCRRQSSCRRGRGGVDIDPDEGPALGAHRAGEHVAELGVGVLGRACAGSRPGPRRGRGHSRRSRRALRRGAAHRHWDHVPAMPAELMARTRQNQNQGLSGRALGASSEVLTCWSRMRNGSPIAEVSSTWIWWRRPAARRPVSP